MSMCGGVYVMVLQNPGCKNQEELEVKTKAGSLCVSTFYAATLSLRILQSDLAFQSVRKLCL